MTTDIRKVKPLPNMTDSTWTNGFWAERFHLAHKEMIESMEKALHEKENGTYLPNFEVAAGLKSDRHYGEDWSDGDCYKFLEACAHVYALTKDPELDQKLDKYISFIAQAQDEDGYISTNVQLSHKKRWGQRIYHEDYNFGHLLTTAVVHYEATGKDSLLNVALKAAEYLNRTFNPCPKHLIHYGWNPSNIMGLVELYRVTGNEQHLKLADIFMTMRGAGYGGEDQNQDRTPLREETEAIGHAVTAVYLYAGAADVFAHTGEEAIMNSLTRIWDDMYLRKMYVTGGVGAIYNGLSKNGDKIWEAFGNEYQLPNRSAYTETCANIGNAMWSMRMFNLTQDAKYMDVFERVVYNSLLGSMTLDGHKFCYTNPLETRGSKLFNHFTPQTQHFRAERWFTHTCYCCPPQVLRTIAKLNQWVYGQSSEGLYIHLYSGNKLSTVLESGEQLELTVSSNFPTDENVQITIESSLKQETSIFLRIPQWATGAVVKVNGEVQPGVAAGSYHEVKRQWQANDRIELVLPMSVKMIAANPMVEEARGQVAFTYGPFVYCLEAHDLPQDVTIDQVRIPRQIKLEASFNADLLGGVTQLKGTAVKIQEANHDVSLYQPFENLELQDIEISLIPYYAWNNRGKADMSVWMPLI
ncbi:glycoside hydrolase family 127 protein [Paenibacillus sp. YYML68]|uniref:glycoside hydrolase family 127 protein n=1 Tax=Paenibacillus sp. YYML68 TaxID=2909250 RepID=UPI00249237F8|nr:beta-L-arabinofuranosidase domain-containing protein [Paenibacillus sp. YYML68]